MPDCEHLDIQPTLSWSSENWLEYACACLAWELAEMLNAAMPDEGTGIHDGIRFLYDYSAHFIGQSNLSLESVENIVEPPPGSAAANIIVALNLTALELKLVILTGLPELHEGLADIISMVNPEKKPRVSVGLAAQMLCPSGDRKDFNRVVHAGNAVKSGLLRLQGDNPLYLQHLFLADIWPLLSGLDVWPETIIPENIEWVDWGLDDWFNHPEVKVTSECLTNNAKVTLRFIADDSSAAVSRAVALIRHIGRYATVFTIATPKDLQSVQLLILHCMARNTVPVLNFSSMEDSHIKPGGLGMFSGTLVVITSGSQQVEIDNRPVLQVDLEKLDIQALTRMWQKAMPGPRGELTAAVLASRFPVEPYIAAQIAIDLECIGSVGGVTDIARQIRIRAGTGIRTGIKLVRPVATWDDLVLKQNSIDQLLDSVNRLKYQARVLNEWGFLKDRCGARGVRILLTGPSGTGKTLSAEVLAKELGVDLLIVDIARVVSKWIGETEKNLEQAFVCAESTRAVLLFDEADALFGKRTEVADAHDRYANLETAYLLTRLERFEGLAIMSTNLRSNIDSAFTRRMEYIVEYDEPGREERQKIWECHMPKHAPVAADVNLAELATVFPVVGGAIRNAAVAAAFSAAAEDSEITRTHFFQALKREYEKQGKSFPGAQRHNLN